MHLWREGLLRRKTEKESGQIAWVTGLFCILLLTVCLMAQLQREKLAVIRTNVEDALAASNLASVIIDIEEYGISHTLKLADPNASYSLFRTALRENLNLSEDWSCPNRKLIAGKVKVTEYIIYNVTEKEITAWRIDENGRLSVSRSLPGSVAAPNGRPVEATGIYSAVTFPVEGLWGIRVQAKFGKLVDIVRNN